MVTTIAIRDVPDEIRAEQAARATSAGRSLEEHPLAELTELARRPGADALLARIRARKAATGASLPAGRIPEHRDRR